MGLFEKKGNFMRLSEENKKVIKNHGMISEKASRVKKAGHIDETIFAELIGGERIPGTRKTDVKNKYHQTFTVKSGSETEGRKKGDCRWQLFLFGKNHFLKELDFPLSSEMISVLSCFPISHIDYEKNKKTTKNKVAVHMVSLKDKFQDKMVIHDFFSKAIFNKEIDFLAVANEGIFHIFDREEVLNIFDSNLTARNSKGMKNSVDSQKVVFDFLSRLTIELEVRTTDDGKYPSMLLVTNKFKILNMLWNFIKKEKKITENIVVWGEAISKFKL